MSHFLMALLPSHRSHTELGQSSRAVLTVGAVPPGGQYNYYGLLKKKKKKKMDLNFEK